MRRFNSLFLLCVGILPSFAYAQSVSTSGKSLSTLTVAGADIGLNVLAVNGPVTFQYGTNPVGLFNVLGNSFPSPPDLSSWDQSTSRIGLIASTPGTGTGGSANQFGLNIQMTIPVTGATAAYTKDAFYSLCRTDDPGVSFAAYCVGSDTRAYIASTNSNGWGTAGVDIAMIENGGDGTLVSRELDVLNYGSNVSDPTTPKSKGGLLIAFAGNNPSTYGIAFGQYPNDPETVHSLIHADGSVITSGGKFLDFGSSFSMTKAGEFGIGTASPLHNAGFGGLTLNGTAGGMASFSVAGAEYSRIQGDGTQLLIDAISNVPVIISSNNTERMRITGTTITFSGLPTACTGMPTNAVWNDAGALKLCP